MKIIIRSLVALASLLVLAVSWAKAEEPQLLDPAQAFRFSARVLDAKTIEVRYVIADGYYLYRQRFNFAVEPATFKLAQPQFPPGDVHHDEFFGRVETYRHEAKILLPLSRPIQPGEFVSLNATSQGCADAGVCYTPKEDKASLNLAGLNPGEGQTQLPIGQRGPSKFEQFIKGPIGSGEIAAPNAKVADAGASAPVGQDESGRIAGLIQGGSFWHVVSIFVGFGVLLAFTPCIYPMMPILSGIIVGQGHSLTKRRALILSATYVLGMAITYAAAGVAAGLSGTVISAAFQNPWVLWGFALIFVLLSLSMFGLFELQLPAAAQRRLSNASNRFRGGGIAGVFIMGALSALIIGPCVAPALAGALLYIGQSRDVVLGGSALFGLALGMGLPLIAVGVSAGALVPRAGAWMEGVKKFFGVLLLGVAIWILSPVIAPMAQLLMWAGLFSLCGVFLGALDPLPQDAPGGRRLSKGLGVIAFVVGAIYVLGAFSGGRDVFQPLSGLSSNSNGGGPSEQSLQFERVATRQQLDARLASARGRYVMLDFYADWCVSCKEMERSTFSDPRIKNRLGNAVLLRADVTANTPEERELLKRFGLVGPPGTIFFDREGQEIRGVRVVGYQSPEKFLQTLDATLI